jgi:hypothetical protein
MVRTSSSPNFECLPEGVLSASPTLCPGGIKQRLKGRFSKEGSVIEVGTRVYQVRRILDAFDSPVDSNHRESEIV